MSDNANRAATRIVPATGISIQALKRPRGPKLLEPSTTRRVSINHLMPIGPRLSYALLVDEIPSDLGLISDSFGRGSRKQQASSARIEKRARRNGEDIPRSLEKTPSRPLDAIAEVSQPTKAYPLKLGIGWKH